MGPIECDDEIQYEQMKNCTFINEHQSIIENFLLRCFSNRNNISQSDLLSSLRSFSKLQSRYGKFKANEVFESLVSWICEKCPNSDEFLDCLTICIKTGESVYDFDAQRKNFLRDLINLLKNVTDDEENLIQIVNEYPLKITEDIFEALFEEKSAESFINFYKLLKKSLNDFDDRVEYLQKVSLNSQPLPLCISDLSLKIVLKTFDLNEDLLARFALIMQRLKEKSWSDEIFLEIIEKVPEKTAKGFDALMNILEISHDLDVSQENFVKLLETVKFKKLYNKIWETQMKFEQSKEIYNYYHELLSLNSMEDGCLLTDIIELKIKSNEVKNCFESSINGIQIKNVSLENISQFVSYLKTNAHLKDEKFAFVIKAMELFYKGKRAIREVQILALIILYYSKNCGLAQVNTGEGKSMICAMLAALFALDGKKVDLGEFL
jgi:SecA DEAD-like domain